MLAGFKLRLVIMSKKKNKIDGNFTFIEHSLVNSEAFKTLSINAKWLYFEFKLRFYGDNRKHIILTYQEAIKIMSINTFIKCRNKLIENGLIDIVKRGGFYKQPAIYGLSERWKQFGTKDFIKVDIRKIEHL
jgi:hypothetical protein